MQCMKKFAFAEIEVRFNTASGMDCMQFRTNFRLSQTMAFQYRKRYGLHAILSPRTLENSEPRNRFSNTEPSKRQVQRTQAIGQRLVCENVPRTRAKGEARLADVDRSSLPFCTFPQTSGNFFVAKSGSKGVQSQIYQGNFCPREKPKTHGSFSQIPDFTVMKYSMKLNCCQYPLRNFFLCKRKGGNTHRERSRFFCRSYSVACSIFLYDGCSACGMPIISRADTSPASRRSPVP